MIRRNCHLAISIDIDRFSDWEIQRRYLSSFVKAGQATTVDEVRVLCREARARGLHVFPPCDQVDERGFCVGHPVEEAGP